jgi:uncharacterized membrane protein
MVWSKGLALLIPGIIFFVTVTLVNSFMDGVIKIVLLLLPTVVILTGVTLVWSSNKKQSA